MADFAQLVECLRGRFPEDGAITVEEADRFPWVRVPASSIVEVCRFLRDDPRLDFNFLRSEAALDLAPAGFGLVYHLLSHHFRHELVLRVEVGREAPEIPSVCSIWPTANWHEREAYDLMGIAFSGHPDLRRLLLPDDWEGHPLRKDWVDPPTIFNIPTQRPSNFELNAPAPKPGAVS